MARPTLRLVEWHERDEARSRASRAKRLRFLTKEYGGGDYRVFYDQLAALAFEEARQAYLHGLFIACTLMCQVCVEQTLCGLLNAVGRNDLKGATYEQILRKARDQKLLSTAEFAKFDRLRQWRNPYVHPRPIGSKGTLIRRAIDSKTSPEQITARDARTAIRALLRLCQRRPFASD